MTGIDLGGLLDGIDPAMVVVTTRSTVIGEGFVGRIARWSPTGGPGWPDADHVCLLLEPVERSTAGSEGWVPLRLSDASDIDTGHDA